MLGSDPVACPTASIAGHLDGTTVVVLALDEPIHRIGAIAAPSDPLLGSVRPLDPSQPRAPPAPLVSIPLDPFIASPSRNHTRRSGGEARPVRRL
jgi:hypothetical protein